MTHDEPAALVELTETEVILLRTYLMLQYHHRDTSAKMRADILPIASKLERAEKEIKFRKQQDEMIDEREGESAF